MAHQVLPDIARRIADHHGVTVEQIRAPRHGPGPKPLRHIGVARDHFAYEGCKERSTTQVGLYLSGRCHTTIMAARDRHAARLAKGEA